MPKRKFTPQDKSADRPVRVDRANAAVCASLTAPAMLSPTEIAEPRQDLKTSNRVALQAFEKNPPIAPMSEEEIERRGIEWIERMVAGLSPGQEKALPGLLRKKALLRKRAVPKKKPGGQIKWDNDRYWVLLIHMAGHIDNRLSRIQALEKCETLYGISTNKIEARIKEARENLRREDLPDWAQWILTKRAKPPPRESMKK